MDKESEVLVYLRQKFPKTVRPRWKQEFLLFHKWNNYSATNTLVQNSTERRSWKAVENVGRNFLGNEKVKIKVK